MKKGLLITTIILATAASIGVYARPESHGNQTTDESAHPQDRSDRIAGIGYVEPATEIRRLVFPLDGVIGQCVVEVGDCVKRNDILIVLRNHKEKQALVVARSEYEMALADRKRILAGVESNELEAARRQCEIAAEKVRHAELEHTRFATLRKSSAASGQEFDLAVTTLKRCEMQLLADQARLRHLERFVRPEDMALADAKVAVAKERVEMAQKIVDDTTLRAPSDGTVLEILKREGDGTRVIDGQPALIFADLSRLRVRAEIDERHIHQLNARMTAVVTGRPLGFREFHGKVARINRLMGPKTVFSRVADERRDLDVVQVLVDMAPDFHYPAGLRVDVYLEQGEKKD